MVTDTAIICARCGESKPPSDYRRDFIEKGYKIFCTPCRAIRAIEDHERWVKRQNDPAYHERQRRRAQEEQRRLEEWRRHWEEERPRRVEEYARQQEEWQRLREERQRLAYTWIRQRSTCELDEHTCRRICYVHGCLHQSGHTWSEVTQQFRALSPSYVGNSPRPQVAKGTRLRVYESQEGKCYYCARVLAPLGPQARLSADDVPQLDHMTPWSRGGTSELANLCYACRVCNQLKYVRTASEFAAMPEDAISKMFLRRDTDSHRAVVRDAGVYGVRE